MDYFYDEKGDLIYFKLINPTYPSGADFYYIRNGQNDITGILDSSGYQVVTYTYDSWGKLLSTTGTLASTVGVKNPYRYRGYRYDVETGLYYLNSRYYNPELGRFINADVIANIVGDLLSCNMYAYCKNNPINLFDPNGYCASIFSGECTPNFMGVCTKCGKFVGTSEESEQISDSNPSFEDPFTVLASEHTKNQRPSTRNKHEFGQTRKKTDQRGEKGDARRSPNPNKRKAQNIKIATPAWERVGWGLLAVGATIAIIAIVADDATLAGIADDAVIIPLGKLVWDSATKAFACA